MSWVEAIRKITRPVITLLVFVATVAFISTGTPIPPEWWVIVTAVGLWWFDERKTRGIIEQLNNQRR